MSVFLLILKIIGIVLLVILGLIVVIALLALFCPFVYRVKGSYHEKNLQLQVRIWWFGRLLGLCADTAEEGFHTYVRIFGFRKELHLQKEKELNSGELIDLTPGLFQRRMLYWHRFAPESRMMRRVTDALIDYGHKVLRQD